MGRHSLPDDDGHRSTGVRRRSRARTVVVATGVVLAVVVGGLAAVQSGLVPIGEECGKGDIALDVVASPDVAPALKDIAVRTRTEEVKITGRCLRVEVKARPSAEVADSLRRGRADFHVWVADSSVWPEGVRARQRGSDLDRLGHVASSPVTLAAIPPAAKALGWPRKSYKWAELAQAGAGGSALDVGAADPARSATALLALQYIHASSATGADESAAATLTASAAKELAKRIQPGDEQVLASLPQDDSAVETASSNEALILSEQAAFAHNSGDADTRLSLFYPKDGAAALDYPYTVLDTPEMETDESVAANRFLTMINDSLGQEVLRRHGFRDVEGAADPRVVSRAGGREPQPYTEQPAETPDAEVMAAMLSMWTITVQPARLVTVVDSSGSMSFPVPSRPGETRMDVTRSALLQALPQFTDEDEIGLWRFSTRLDGSRDYEELVPAKRLGDRVDGSTMQRDRLSRAFGELRPVPDGATGLYDTALAAYKKALDGYAPGKFNALVILTDGANDDPGSIGLDALTRQLKELVDPERPVGLITLAVGPDADAGACAKIAKAAGGASYPVQDPADIQQVLLKAVMDAARVAGE